MCIASPVEILPGVWVDEGLVEIDAKVAMDCHHPETPDVYLEMLITAPDTREHESLLVSDVKPSNLHAGLLAAGFEPGSPILYKGDSTVAASGDPILVEVQVQGSDDWVSLIDWVVHVTDESSVKDDQDWKGLVFAGSVLIDDGLYKADREGALVSLTAWGFEVVSPVWTVSPDASTDEPVWIADRDSVPEIQTPVRVRFRNGDIELVTD